MDKNKKIFERKLRRSHRTKAKLSGTAKTPRIAVFRSNKFISAQAIDDVKMNTLACAESRVVAKGKKINKTEAAKLTGLALGKLLSEKGIKNAIFDRRSYRYHGRVKALAEALREAGIKM